MNAHHEMSHEEIARTRLEVLRREHRDLDEAIAAGGSSLRDYRRADGELGYFQHSFAVYGREGAPCPRCGGPVARLVQSGRSSFFCPACQTGTQARRRANTGA